MPNFWQQNVTMSELPQSSIRLKGLALREYSSSSYPVNDILPHRHQWALHDALTNDVPGAFVNDAPTGAGKTLSWLAPTVSEGLDTVAVYPTNALIEDQRENIESLLSNIDGGDDVHLLPISSEILQDEHATEYDVDSNGKVLSYLLRDAFQRPETVILLTNPDIFVLLRRKFHHRFANHRADIRSLPLMQPHSVFLFLRGFADVVPFANACLDADVHELPPSS